MNKLRNELIKIAHSYGVTVRFSKRVVVPYADVHESHIVLRKPEGLTTAIWLSDFFHELGHVIDYRNGIYRKYYHKVPSHRDLRLYALKAELHTDETGAKLMKQYYPRLTFQYTYKYKKWQKFLREYWGIE